jgi:hypothetical protein
MKTWRLENKRTMHMTVPLWGTPLFASKFLWGMYLKPQQFADLPKPFNITKLPTEDLDY